jgi:hypothetical protein
MAIMPQIQRRFRPIWLDNAGGRSTAYGISWRYNTLSLRAPLVSLARKGAHIASVLIAVADIIHSNHYYLTWCGSERSGRGAV